MSLSNQQFSAIAMKIRDRLKALSVSRYAELSTRLETLALGIEQLHNFRRTCLPLLGR
jgi:hypothetical protein